MIHLLRALIPVLAGFAVLFLACALTLECPVVASAFALGCVAALALHGLLPWGMGRQSRAALACLG